MDGRRIVVVGTGTEVGKTHVACALLCALRAGGEAAVGCKPIESGLRDQETAGKGGSDSHRLAIASGMFHVKHPPYLFDPPVSPHLAARQSGVRIDPALLRAWITEIQGPGSAVIETAGGLFSPLDRGLTNLDLFLALRPALLLLVAPDRLGVLHDLTSTLGLARARGVTVSAVVLSAPAQPDASTTTNATELATLGISDIAASFPRASPDAPESRIASLRALAAMAGAGAPTSLIR